MSFDKALYICRNKLLSQPSVSLYGYIRISVGGDNLPDWYQRYFYKE